MFEVFTRGRRRRSPGPRVTITNRGYLSINAAAYALLGEPPAVELLFDRSQRVAGLRASTDRTSAYRVRRTAARGSHLIAFRAFCAYYAIAAGTSRKVPAAWDDASNALTFPVE